jgi:hypothetical protein
MADFNMGEGHPDQGIRPTDPLDFSSSTSPPIITSSILNVAPGSLSLSIEEQNSMVTSIQNIFKLEEEDPKEEEEMAEGEDDENEVPVVDLEDQARRTERLKGVLSILAQLWWADSQQMELAAEKLADASRDCKSLYSRALPSIHFVFLSNQGLHSDSSLEFLLHMRSKTTLLNHIIKLTSFQQNGEYL